MNTENKNEELQSRREFFKKAAKVALPVVGTFLLAGVPQIMQAATDCNSNCTNGCYGGCAGSCTGTCSGSCNNGCNDNCYGSCRGTCSNNCGNVCQ